MEYCKPGFFGKDMKNPIRFIPFVIFSAGGTCKILSKNGNILRFCFPRRFSLVI
jgi:hypothetical protein